jgi:hypothetical protein
MVNGTTPLHLFLLYRQDHPRRMQRDLDDLYWIQIKKVEDIIEKILESEGDWFKAFRKLVDDDYQRVPSTHCSASGSLDPSGHCL